jgi:hypothetical protein
VQARRDFPDEGYTVTFVLEPHVPFRTLLLLDAASHGLRTFDGHRLMGNFFYPDVRIVSALGVQAWMKRSAQARTCRLAELDLHASLSGGNRAPSHRGLSRVSCCPAAEKLSSPEHARFFLSICRWPRAWPSPTASHGRCLPRICRATPSSTSTLLQRLE